VAKAKVHEKLQGQRGRSLTGQHPLLIVAKNLMMAKRKMQRAKCLSRFVTDTVTSGFEHKVDQNHAHTVLAVFKGGYLADQHCTHDG
jgi:hypothetical protein